MRMLRGVGRFIWRFMVIFSFIVNIVLVIVLLVLGVLIFEIKNQVAQPLVTGLHSSFVGLDQATIDWTIPVRDSIPVVLDIPLETETVVTLVEPVPLQVGASIDLPGLNAANVPATVRLQLPVGLELPVALDLDVAVDQPLDVALDVRAVIPLQETQLHDVAENLRLLFEPLALGLTNLPSNFGETPGFVGDLLGGNVNLLAANEYSAQPWPGFSQTAGFGYDLYVEPVPQTNIPLETGIVPIGGIPALDAQLRPELYTDDVDGPEEVNQLARTQLQANGVGEIYYNGTIGNLLVMTAAGFSGQQAPEGEGGTPIEDQGIITPEAPPGTDPGTQPTAVPPANTTDGEAGEADEDSPSSPDLGIITEPGG